MSNQEKVWKVGVWVGVLLAVFLLVVSIKGLKEIGYVGKDVPIMNSISVNGKGEQFGTPDIATFSFTVTEEAKTVDAAQLAATTKVNAATKAMKDNGIADKDIKTTSYNISPQYDYVQELCVSGNCKSGHQVLRGYEVSQTTEIKVRDIKKAGALFETIGSLGVQNVNSLAFSIDDIDGVKAKARTIAINDAKSKAELLAQQLGVRLGRITSYYDSSDNQPYYGYAEKAMGGDSMVRSAVAPMAAPTVSTGEQKVVSQVTITYEIR